MVYGLGSRLLLPRQGLPGDGPDLAGLPSGTATERPVSLGTLGERGTEVGAFRVGLIENPRTRRISVDVYGPGSGPWLFVSIRIPFDHDRVVAVVTQKGGYAPPEGAPTGDNGSLWHLLTWRYLLTRGAWPPRQFLPPVERHYWRGVKTVLYYVCVRFNVWLAFDSRSCYGLLAPEPDEPVAPPDESGGSVDQNSQSGTRTPTAADTVGCGQVREFDILRCREPSRRHIRQYDLRAEAAGTARVRRASCVTATPQSQEAGRLSPGTDSLRDRITSRGPAGRRPRRRPGAVGAASRVSLTPATVCRPPVRPPIHASAHTDAPFGVESMKVCLRAAGRALTTTQPVMPERRRGGLSTRG